MKTLKIVLILTALPVFSLAQRLNLNAGTNISSLSRSFNDNKISTQSIVGLNVGLQFDYLDKSSFFLSSSLYFSQKGGIIPTTDIHGNITSPINYKDVYNYLGFNTLFNYKLNLSFMESFNPVVFAGPRLDFLANIRSNHGYVTVKDFNRVNVGVDAGFSLRYDVNQLSFGFRAYYLQSFNQIFESEPVENLSGGASNAKIEIKDRTFSTQFSVGYNF